MNPLLFFFITLVFTFGSYVTSMILKRRRSHELQRLARLWQMHYSARDQLRLSAKVATAFPIPGVANLRITDLIYGQSDGSHRYIFTAEYTVGVLRAKRRIVRIASLVEPKDSASGANPDHRMRLGPVELTLLEQYVYLAPPGSPKL